MATQFTVFIVILVMLMPLAFVGGQEKGAKYGYKGDTGPEKWGDLSPEFKTCSSGKAQSPVDICKQTVKMDDKLGNLKRQYKQPNATLVNKCTHVGIQWSPGSGRGLTLDGKDYKLEESVWHTPGEHTINNKKQVAELQHIHRSDDGKVAVVVNLYKDGDADKFHEELKEAFGKLKACSGDQQVEVPVGAISSKYLTRSPRKYYRYVGSLTIPPCTEDVIWIILAKVRELSKEQRESLKKPLSEGCKSNARPVQQLNERQVQMFSGEPNDKDDSKDGDDEKSKDDDKDTKDKEESSKDNEDQGSKEKEESSKDKDSSKDEDDQVVYKDEDGSREEESGEDSRAESPYGAELPDGAESPDDQSNTAESPY